MGPEYGPRAGRLSGRTISFPKEGFLEEFDRSVPSAPVHHPHPYPYPYPYPYQMDDDGVASAPSAISAISAISALAARTDLPPAKLHSVKRAIISQMQLGLSDKNLGLMMLPSFVDAFPSSLRPSAAGPYYAIDLGGTSLKVVRIELRDDGKLGDLRKQEWAIPDECYDTDNGRLLAWIVECFTAMFTRVVKPIIGFCYSFACR